MSETALALTRPDPAVLADRWTHGEKVEDLAAEYGVSHQTIYTWINGWTLSNAGGPSYEELKERVHVHNIVKSNEMVLNAADQLELARAREYGKNVRWDAERKCPKSFGLKQGDSEKTIVVIDRSASEQGRNAQAIDVTPQQITDGN